jgi:hypothetical protein
MSPLGIKRFIALVLVLSPWVFLPGLFKDAIFIALGILLFVSTMDLRKRSKISPDQETESMPHREVATM